LPAGFSTSAARLGALSHLRILAKLIAILGARLADLRASAAGQVVEIRPAEHEISAGSADLNAIGHQPQVLWPGMLAALHQAMVDRRKANLVAVRAFIDAMSQVVVHHWAPLANKSLAANGPDAPAHGPANQQFASRRFNNKGWKLAFHLRSSSKAKRYD
jgi:hypothetical protein